MHKGYTLNYFIDFFSKIPNHRWTEGKLQEPGTVRLCALGHVATGSNPTVDRLRKPAGARIEALQNFLDGKLVCINDNTEDRFNFLGKTPRGRVLKALRNRKRYGNIYGTKKSPDESGLG